MTIDILTLLSLCWKIIEKIIDVCRGRKRQQLEEEQIGLENRKLAGELARQPQHEPEVLRASPPTPKSHWRRTTKVAQRYVFYIFVVVSSSNNLSARQPANLAVDRNTSKKPASRLWKKLYKPRKKVGKTNRRSSRTTYLTFLMLMALSTVRAQVQTHPSAQTQTEIPLRMEVTTYCGRQLVRLTSPALFKFKLKSPRGTFTERSLVFSDDNGIYTYHLGSSGPWPLTIDFLKNSPTLPALFKFKLKSPCETFTERSLVFSDDNGIYTYHLSSSGPWPLTIDFLKNSPTLEIEVSLPKASPEWLPVTSPSRPVVLRKLVAGIRKTVKIP